VKNEEKYHLPVMGPEIVDYLISKPSGIYVDGTCGTGGHSSLILEKLSGEGKLIACDLDERMLAIAENRNREVQGMVRFLNCGYHQVARFLEPEEKPLSGFLMDLGICSLQLDESHGFAFKSDNPLDMRFNTRSSLTAADIVNEFTRKQLLIIFKEYGDLKQAKSLADIIVKERQKFEIKTTFQLKSIVGYLFPSERINQGLAKLGQALRIAVNGELDNLRLGLKSLTGLLETGGRLVVLSYHSLEDRIVKNFIRSYSRESGYPPDLEDLFEKREFKLRPLTHKALTPSSQEIDSNPRARSAKLRVAVKV
jgi:16S rRNA (cytosine1402-N4)-methyltransferase